MVFFRFNQKKLSSLYTTFIHTEVADKFRIVFVLDRVVDNYTDITSIIGQLLNNYPQADKSYKDGCRLFYGGKKFYWFSKDNKVDTEQILRESLEWDRKNNNFITTQTLRKNLSIFHVKIN